MYDQWVICVWSAACIPFAAGHSWQGARADAPKACVPDGFRHISNWEVLSPARFSLDPTRSHSVHLGSHSIPLDPTQSNSVLTRSHSIPLSPTRFSLDPTRFQLNPTRFPFGSFYPSDSILSLRPHWIQLHWIRHLSSWHLPN